MRAAIAALLVSCAKPAPPRVVVAPTPPPPPPAFTCADAAQKLDEPDVDEHRVAAMAETCEQSHWSAAQLACIQRGEGDWKKRCYDQLTDAQKEDFDGALVTWAETYAREEPVDDGPPVDPFVACEDAIHDASLWDPPADAPLAAAMRKRVLVQACNSDDWGGEVRACLAKANDRASTNSCAAKLPPDKLQTAGAQVARVDELAARTAKGAAHPPTCAALVGKHYGDAAWKGKLDGAKDRAQLIARSRTQMLEACKRWDAQTKACLFAGGAAACFAEAFAWTYPAAGVAPAATGLAECDAYLADMEAVDRCAKIPQASRDAMRDALSQLRDTFKDVRTLPADQKQTMVESCKYGADALRELLAQVGC